VDFSKMLAELASQRKLAAVYTDSDNVDAFSAGFVRGVGDDCFSMLTISREGEEDGLIVHRLSDVIRIEEKSRYLEQLHWLHENRGNVFHPWGGALPPSIGEDCLVSELKRALDDGLVVTIQLGPNAGQELLFGFVTAMDETTVTVSALTRYGESDGVSTVLLADIYRINCDTREEQVLAFLHRRGSSG